MFFYTNPIRKIVWPLQVNYAQIRNDIRLQSKIFILVVKKRKNFALKKQVLRFQKFNRQRDMSKKMTLALSASYISFLYCISLKKNQTNISLNEKFQQIASIFCSFFCDFHFVLVGTLSFPK